CTTRCIDRPGLRCPQGYRCDTESSTPVPLPFCVLEPAPPPLKATPLCQRIEAGRYYDVILEEDPADEAKAWRQLEACAVPADDWCMRGLVSHRAGVTLQPTGRELAQALARCRALPPEGQRCTAASYRALHPKMCQSVGERR